MSWTSGGHYRLADTTSILTSGTGCLCSPSRGGTSGLTDNSTQPPQGTSAMKKLQLIDGEQQSKSVGIWIRVSTEDQARGESPEHHEKRARAYAEAKAWKVREVYHLEAVSGKSVMGHAETKRMLGHLASGHITGLIFSKLARLARNTRELLDFADIFRDHEADLISLHESIDPTNPAVRLF